MFIRMFSALGKLRFGMKVQYTPISTVAIAFQLSSLTLNKRSAMD